MSDTQTYMLDEAGKLHRKGVHIATLNEADQLVFHNPEDRTKYQGTVTRWLKEEADRKALASQTTDTTGANDSPLARGELPTPPAPVLTEEQKGKLDEKSLAAEGAREAAKYAADVKDDRDFATRNGCPQPPKKNPQFGDKTPAYVEWLKQYRPDKFKAKYGVKGKGQVAVFKKNEETGETEHVGYKEADMAERKTHLTEKIETAQGLSDDMSWDA